MKKIALLCGLALSLVSMPALARPPIRTNNSELKIINQCVDEMHMFSACKEATYSYMYRVIGPAQDSLRRTIPNHYKYRVCVNKSPEPFGSALNSCAAEYLGWN
jgi:hypothetical protein